MMKRLSLAIRVLFAGTPELHSIELRFKADADTVKFKSIKRAVDELRDAEYTLTGITTGYSRKVGGHELMRFLQHAHSRLLWLVDNIESESTDD